MLEDISKFWSKWMSGKRSQQLMNVVVEAMTEARQKVRASDSPFKSLARKCIDKAEDAYQDAIYYLKDGEPQLCFQNCKQGLKFLSMAMLHLSDLSGRITEPLLEEESAEQTVIKLSEAITRFKASVEYTNAEVNSEQKERLADVVSLYFDAIDHVAKGESGSAEICAQAGLLLMYLLGRELEVKLQSCVVEPETLERFRGSSAARIIALIDQYAETLKLLAEASVVAHGRIKLYIDAARRTLDQTIVSYQDSDSEDVARLAKAGSMELRMANRLIDYARYPNSGPEPEDDTGILEDLEEPAQVFKRRVARLQRLLRDKDEESAVVRRLGVVSSYVSRARTLLANGDYTEAERYARSAHLDIDFARQLLTEHHATYSDII